MRTLLPILTILVFGCASSNDQHRAIAEGDGGPETHATKSEPPPGAEPPASSATASDPQTLHIQLLGEDFPPAFMEDMAYVKEAVEAFYRFDVQFLRPAALPEAAWYAPRKRYRAEVLLDYLESRRPSAGDRVMGITLKDISTTKGHYEDWGILGLATVDGTVSVISTFRTGGKKAGAPAWKKERARIRFAKTVVHELGHNLGLLHCPHRGCIMEDAMGTVTTTDREYSLCDECRRLAEEANPGILSDPLLPPWPDPRAK